VKPWFVGKLDFSPPVVDLAAQGYPLVGGRVDYVAGRQVAALVYQRRQHVINLFVAPSADALTGPAAQSTRGFHVRRWTRGEMSFAAVSDLNDAELDAFVKAVQAP
jgi:anti-sigma factor RsiW